jgi:NAD-dependent deacetylase
MSLSRTTQIWWELGVGGWELSQYPALVVAAVEDARQLIDDSARVVVLAGAGISTDSGIPDFRGPQGVWTLNPKAQHMSDIRYYVSDRDVRKLSWQSRLAHPAWTAQPNAGHRALVALEQRGKLHALITQNIDGLHQQAGNNPALVIEVHGTLHKAVCLSCGSRQPMQAVLDRVRGGDVDPECERCGGILKSDTVSFGQPLVPHVIERALRASAETDCLLAVGTSLQVYPIAAAVPNARGVGARLIIVNTQPTPFDDIADVKLTDSISVVLPVLCGSQAM